MITALALLLLLPLGRGSGGHYAGNWSTVCNVAIGVVLGYLLGVHSCALLAYGVGAWLAELTSPAKYCTGLITDKYADNKGRGWAWFEIEYIRERPWLGVTARGLISFLAFTPIALLGLGPVWPLGAFILAWPLALWLGTRLPVVRGVDAWQWAEMLRPVIVGLVIIILPL